ncbi:allophanate hydrolase-related protein [Glycomyces buryatensis]|uniref:Gamma-glutamylcyclotransferase n=1 Tax=Glycomyces buryatensis TaxID=2570927 RepID=A0A4S8Q4P2_9ACTN|nr:gamma-glutamylcyclotransferase [Glycomyces buryatensis]THV35609.1 gamma-glutamylcyclotransferase [Glycomyces buryatensis]
MVHMFLNGGGMKGGNLHHLIGGAPFVGPAKTLPIYRLHSVGDDHPALEPAGEGTGEGATIEGELYDIDLRVLRESLLPAEPADLELGVVGLADGTEALGMRLRRECSDLPELIDITAYGSWRAYLASKTDAS